MDVDAGDCQTSQVHVGTHRRCEDGQPFVVLRGKALVEVDDSDSLLYLRQGTVYALPAQLETRWFVSEEIEFLAVNGVAVRLPALAGCVRGADDGVPMPPRTAATRR